MARFATFTTPRWQGPLLVSVVFALMGLAIVGSSVRITRAEPQATDTSTDDKRKPDSLPSSTVDWQVTVIGILVTPGEMSGTIDPRLASIKNQLRKLIPADHGFKLLDVRSDRLSAGQSVRCDLGKDRLARVTLVDPLDPEGKVKLRCELTRGKVRLTASEVATPLNQLFFCEHALEDGSKLLIGVGAR